jgi:xylulokinase
MANKPTHKRKYLIGVDLGTSATKAAAYRIDGSLVAEASQEVPLYYPSPGVVEQENEDFYNTAAVCVRQCIQASGIDAREVAAVAFDSQMAGIGSVDEGFKPATRFDSWLDMRCEPFIDWMDQQAGDRVTQLTGCPPTCNHGAKMLWWQHERPDEFARVASFLTPSGYVAGRAAELRGDQAFMDATFLHFSGFSDAQAGTWSQELCQLFGLDSGKLPGIVEPWQIVGEFSQSSARDFDLAPGTPIAAGCGDTAANALGAGIVRPGMLFDVAGTAAVFAACTDRYVADVENRALLTMRSVIPGLWHPLAYIAGGGLALRWFRDKFYNQFRGQEGAVESDLYECMCQEVSRVPPGAQDLFFSPHLGGRICPAAPEMRGAWVGFSWGHSQEYFLRALLESVAYEYAYYLRILKQALPEIDLKETRVIGGGARSPEWNKIKASVLNVPYRTLKRSEFGTWGAALIAGKAVGLFQDLATAAQDFAQPDGQAYLPDAEMSQAYQGLIERYISFQETLRGYFEQQ